MAGLLENLANELERLIINPVKGLARDAEEVSEPGIRAAKKRKADANAASLERQFMSSGPAGQNLVDALSGLTGGEKVATKPNAPIGFQAMEKPDPLRRILESLLMLQDFDEDVLLQELMGAE